MRTALALACLAAARYVPFLAYFMSLIGSFLTIAVSVVLPISLHLKIFQVCLLCFQAGLPLSFPGCRRQAGWRALQLSMVFKSI